MYYEDDVSRSKYPHLFGSYEDEYGGEFVRASLAETDEGDAKALVVELSNGTVVCDRGEYVELLDAYVVARDLISVE